MKVNFLGTGTSQGIPVIGCQCPTCCSSNPQDKRLRTSVSLQWDNFHLVIDVGPDFRQQMLNMKANHLDAVLLTHEHNDHVIGLDDLRPFNFQKGEDMPIHGEKNVLDELKTRFAYAFIPSPYPGVPKFDFISIQAFENFELGGMKIEPLRVMHGPLPILGYKIGGFCYLTDFKTIPQQTMDIIRGAEVLVISSLRRKDHHSHATFSEALAVANEVSAKRAYFTHFSHRMGPVAEFQKEMPSGVFPAYDGLEINL